MKSSAGHLKRPNGETNQQVTIVRVGSYIDGGGYHPGGDVCQKTLLTVGERERLSQAIALDAGDYDRSVILHTGHPLYNDGPTSRVRSPPVIPSHSRMPKLPYFNVKLTSSASNSSPQHSPKSPQNHQLGPVSAQTASNYNDVIGSITNIHVSPSSTPNSGSVITKVKPNPPEKPTLAKKPNQHCSPEGNMSPTPVIRRQNSGATERTLLRSPLTRLRSTSSGRQSPTVSVGSADSGDESPRLSEDSDDDEDAGVYMESHRHSRYIYLSTGSLNENATSALKSYGDIDIGEQDDNVSMLSHISEASNESGSSQTANTKRGVDYKRSISCDNNKSEVEFRRKYKHCTVKTIQRKSRVHGYQRMSERICDSSRDLMIVKGDGGSFGFQIHGSQPAVISTVDIDSPADMQGLCQGDVVVSVNSVNVLEATHSEIIKLMIQDSNCVELSVTSSSDVGVEGDLPLLCGYLMKQAGTGVLKNFTWRKRWFILKQDHCLYYYKSEEDKDPLGAILLSNYIITRVPDSSKRYEFRATKFGQRTYCFQADTEQDMNRWASAMNSAAQAKNKCNTWLDISSHNVSLAALTIKNPDCHGVLCKMGNRYRSWKRRYCVLKDACLYYYLDVSSNTALGVAHLHGYTVSDNLPYSRSRKFGFSLTPPEENMRTFCFSADNDTERERWMTAMRKAIARWVTVTND